MQQLTIGSGPAGTLLVAADEDSPVPTVIQNVDTANVLYLGKEVSVNPSIPTECAPLYPGQTTIATGDVTLFGIAAPGQTVAISLYEGVMSFFQPVNLNNRTLLGGYFISGSGGGTQWLNAKPTTPGFYLYYDDGVNPPVLAFSISIAPGSDQWGNTWPGGQQIVGLPTLTNVFTVIDTSGNTLVSIDNSGDITGQTLNAGTDVIVNGESIPNDIIAPMPQGLINRGWSGTPPWPPTAIGGTDTPLIELDAIIPAGREYRFRVMPATILLSTAPAGPTQFIMHLRFTNDGSTPTTASPDFSGHGPMVMTIPVTNLLNYVTPLKEIILGSGVDIQYRILVSASIQSGSFKFQTFLEAIWEDMGAIGAQFANAATILGTGTSGGGSKQTYTKTYNAVEFANYYGSTASYGSGPNSMRDHNASKMYQGTPSGYLGLTGDQYAFARFNYSQINTDVGAGVVNWVKLRLTNQHFWYSGGGNAVVGWSSFTGTYGTFAPGGSHMNTDHYGMGEGATTTHTMSGTFASSIASGFTSIILGTSASYTNNTDLNNYGFFAGAGSLSTCPQLQINYTK